MQPDQRKRLPYQMEVYFDTFPQLDIRHLASFINDSEPGEEPCEIQEVTLDAEECGLGGEPQIRIAAYSASLGEMIMGILVHGVPSPTPETILGSRLPDATKQHLLKHEAFALLTNLGGEEYVAYEQQIFLLKMAMAMCDQGASGAGYPHLHICFPADLLLGLLQAGKGTVDGKTHTLWSSVREDGEPMQLFADIVSFEADSDKWLATRGFAFCGFPDLIYRVSPGEDISEISQLFQNAFPYLMTNGPVITAGHTMGYDENVAFRFSDPPGELELPFESHGAFLLVTRESPEPRKKRFGVF